MGLARPVYSAEPAGPWQGEFQRFAELDKQSPPPKDPILFVGSSSIRMWELEKSFPKRPVLNRGFGGSRIPDSTQAFDRIVLPYKPSTVVFYAGDNDIAAGATAEQVASDFLAFVKKMRAGLPGARLIYISIKPSPSRWKFADTVRKANGLIEKSIAEQQPGKEAGKQFVYLDVFKPMLSAEGAPRPELFLPDQLHMNPTGYRLWTELLAPVLADR